MTLLYIYAHPHVHVNVRSGVAAWWEINVQEWMMGMSNPAALAQLIRKVPPGLPEARAKLLYVSVKSSEARAVSLFETRRLLQVRAVALFICGWVFCAWWVSPLLA